MSYMPSVNWRFSSILLEYFPERKRKKCAVLLQTKCWQEGQGDLVYKKNMTNDVSSQTCKCHKCFKQRLKQDSGKFCNEQCFFIISFKCHNFAFFLGNSSGKCRGIIKFTYLWSTINVFYWFWLNLIVFCHLYSY